VLYSLSPFASRRQFWFLFSFQRNRRFRTVSTIAGCLAYLIITQVLLNFEVGSAPQPNGPIVRETTETNVAGVRGKEAMLQQAKVKPDYSLQVLWNTDRWEALKSKVGPLLGSSRSSLSPAELADVRAVEGMLTRANQALNQPIKTVMDKLGIAPSGNKHDFVRSFGFDAKFPGNGVFFEFAGSIPLSPAKKEPSLVISLLSHASLVFADFLHSWQGWGDASRRFQSEIRQDCPLGHGGCMHRPFFSLLLDGSESIRR